MALTVARLKELLEYDPETGVFRSKINRGRAIAGKVLGGTRGYSQIVIDRRNYKGHHLAWLYVYGEWPSSGLDHINGVVGDNRIANLRLASQQQNVWNKGPSKNNTSGFKGVSLHRGTGKWRATITVNRQQKSLGHFATPEAAYDVYCSKAKEVFGEFARTK